MLKNIKNVCILVAICSAMAILLALTNQITAPIIEKNAQIKAAAALREVMPEGETFTLVEDLSGYTLPATVTEVHKEDGGKGYVIKLTTKGFGTDMIIMCGVTTDGVVTGAQCLSSNETLSYEKTYGKNFANKDAAGVDAVETIGGATMTTAAYKAAVKDAINTVSILKGEVVDLRSPEEKALDQMKADLEATEEADLSQYTLPASVTKALKGTKGSIVYLTVEGYKPGMEIVCGVSADNKIVNAICLKSNETNGKEKTYGEQFIGKDAAGIDAVDTIAGSTMTTAAFKQAMKDALNAAIVLGGGDVDIRTPEEILQDNLKAALPAGEGKFTKLFFTEKVEGVDAVYAADNGAGYVAVAVAEEIGEDFTGEFIGIDANMNIVTAGSTVNTEAALTAVKALSASTSTDVDLTAYKGINENITSIKKTASGNYDITINGLGFGYFGNSEHYQDPKYIPIVIRVSLTPDGKIIDTLTVSHEETKGYGAGWGTEEYYGQFDGTTIDTYKDVDVISGATISNNGYLKAIERCFLAVEILEGGAK